ncbi:clostripain-related cysteine peptidase [Eubacteriales bacterium OttesenSCG-928-N13]|nr:clostripain-related cysteine peptidase [Eubacteriales bacterium OttesenSCG-928-N13]
MKHFLYKGIALLVAFMILMPFQMVGTPSARAWSIWDTDQGQEESVPNDSAPGNSADGQPSQGAELAEWSIFLYLCGTDLESDGGAATENLLELGRAQWPSDVQFIIQTGGTQNWQNGTIDPDKVQRWLFHEGDIILLDEQPLSSMGHTDTLGEFLAWGTQAFPAQKNMLIMWDHGGGSLTGIAFDELYDDDSLTLMELSDALKYSGAQFELIGFDACLMATLETMAAIAPYANYMVASEEYEPGGGWDYEAFMNYLGNNPGANGADFGKAICDTYYQKCERDQNQSMATLSVVDLQKVEPLIAAFDSMAFEMTGTTQEISSFQTFIQGATRAENYGGNNDSEGYTNMVDLGDMVMNTQSVLPDTADAVLTALFDSVIYEVHGNERSSANGIAVFFPLGYADGMLDEYARISPSGKYVRFLEAATDWQAPDDYEEPVSVEDSVVSSKDDYTLEYNTYIDQDDYFTLQVDQGLETINSVQFALYYMDVDNDEFVLLGLDNDIENDWENGIFHDNFRGMNMAINDSLCAPVLVAENDKYNVYSVPITLNGEDTHLRCAYIWDSEDEGHYEVHGIWNGIDSATGMSARDLRKLVDGDVVTTLCTAINWDTGEEITYELDTFTVNGPVTMDEVELIDGEYLYMFYLTDVFGADYWSDSVLMNFENGEISLQSVEDA